MAFPLSFPSGFCCCQINGKVGLLIPWEENGREKNLLVWGSNSERGNKDKRGSRLV